METPQFTLTIHDRKGIELKLGDVVAISDGRALTFYAEVKYLEAEQVITPFHTFSFHSFEKVDKVPDNAIKSTEERYNIWFLYHDDAPSDEQAKNFNDYLLSWRECECHLETRMWRIKMSNTQLKLL